VRKLLQAGLVVVVLWPSDARALDPGRAITQYRRDHWHTKDGLPQSSVEAIAQSRDGYLWFGTQEGVARFDGVRFVVFDKSNTPALRANRILSLLADRRGGVWMGTDGGGMTRYDRGTFTTFRAKEGLPGDTVGCLAQDQEGNVWIGTDRGLARFGAGGLKTYTTADGLPAGPVGALLARRAGGVWVGTDTGLVSVEAGRPLSRVPGTRGRVSALWEDADGTLWLGGNGALTAVRPESSRTYSPADGLPAHSVQALRRDRDGSLWIGTDGGGLARFRDGRFSIVSTKDGLPTDMVLQVFEDLEGSLWIGMHDGGLDRLRDAKFVTFTTREGLAGDDVWPVFQDREGSLWFGTSNAGLSRLKGGVFTTFTTRDGLPSNAVQALAQDGSGTLWVGTRGGGLSRIDGGKVSAVAPRGGLPGTAIGALCADRDGSLWIGTRGFGVVRLRGGAFSEVPGLEMVKDVAIHSIHQDRRGDVWIATNGRGLLHIHEGVVAALTTRDGLASDIVNAVREGSDGSLWIATFGGGLGRLRGGRITSYTVAQGLYDDAVFQVLEDGGRNLWMSCNKGISRVSIAEMDALDRGAVASLHPVAYGTADGMKNRECNGANQPAGIRAADGRLWFPTIEGVVVVDPEHLPTNRVAPPVVLESLLVDGAPLAARDRLELPPGKESLEFQYTALSFAVPERVRFRYKLEGLDRDWVEAGARRVAYYTRIPPGSYRFVARAANDDGVWNEAGAALSFRLRPRFYQTPWFYAVMAIGLGGLGVLAYRVQVGRAQAREETLVRLVEKRTRQLEEANQALERLSSLDGLTGIANRRSFDQALELEWRRGARTGAPLSLILMDVDSFKAYNDAYGHPGGDEALKRVATALAASLGRAGDLVARYGGEEFVALLPGMAAPDAHVVAERLRDLVEGLGVRHSASATARVLTVSAGVATFFPSEDSSASGLLAAADKALYQAKRSGRNRVVAAPVVAGPPAAG
jgi:diguanylate cyclase (GGDEF)-like protein